MRMTIIALFVITAALLGQMQISNAQSPYSYPWCAVSGAGSSGKGRRHVLLLHELGAVHDNNVRPTNSDSQMDLRLRRSRRPARVSLFRQ